ncbi:MAG TPA: hypothetical protein VMV25_03890 [Steroidobacteraceae bacterium]|nr:hypothetical protein [Steroidobacteraceae bacterium]
MNLIHKNENPLKIIAAIISLFVWGALLVVTKGLILIYVALIGLIYLFAQSGLVSHIKGTGVKVSPDQYPDIHAQLEQSCRTVELTNVPDCYVLRMNVFNALATRFLGCSFVVLYAEVVDAPRDRQRRISPAGDECTRPCRPNGGIRLILDVVPRAVRRLSVADQAGRRDHGARRSQGAQLPQAKPVCMAVGGDRHPHLRQARPTGCLLLAELRAIIDSGVTTRWT